MPAIVVLFHEFIVKNMNLCPLPCSHLTSALLLEHLSTILSRVIVIRCIRTSLYIARSSAWKKKSVSMQILCLNYVFIWSVQHSFLLVEKFMYLFVCLFVFVIERLIEFVDEVVFITVKIFQVEGMLN